MKVITKENNVIVYVVEDNTVITQDENQTYIGEPVNCYFPSVTVSNSVIHEGVVDIPDEVRAKLYCYDGSGFTLNEDHYMVKAEREKRDTLLSETDWWCLSDQTPTQAQLDYRQALRDITTHANWPNLTDADWPVKPS